MDDLNKIIEKHLPNGNLKVKETFDIVRLTFYKKNGFYWLDEKISIEESNYEIKPSEFYKIDGIPFEINREGKLVTI